jgi:hypothetical protein
MRLERTAATGFEGSAGFTTPAYSFGGGTSSTQNQAGTERDLIDVNGHGLPDLVYKAVNSDITSGGTTIQVRLNAGAGFLPAQTWNGAQPLPIQNRRFLANGSDAVTDMSYDSEGKLTTVTGPANLNGERYGLTYIYDTVVRVHVESVTDNFPAPQGPYVSTSTHDYKFAEVTSATDENGQVVSNAYDNFGRLATVIGPYEQGTGNTTITFAYSPLTAVPWALTSHVDTLGPMILPLFHGDRD